MRSWAYALSSWLLVSACANEDVVLFDFRGGGVAGASGTPGANGTGGAAAGGTGSDTMTSGDTSSAGAGDSTNSESPPSCQSNVNCEVGWSCEKANCSDTTGSCIASPVSCDQSPDPVCGCDGVTYWNDCLRQQAGQSASTKGQCGLNLKPCRNAADCGGNGTACGHLAVPAEACNQGMFGQRGPGPDPQGNPPPLGTCWSIPSSCDAIPDTLAWNECGAEAPATCLDTCSALRTGRFFVQSPAGSCP